MVKNEIVNQYIWNLFDECLFKNPRELRVKTGNTIQSLVLTWEDTQEQRTAATDENEKRVLIGIEIGILSAIANIIKEQGTVPKEVEQEIQRQLIAATLQAATL